MRSMMPRARWSFTIVLMLMCVAAAPAAADPLDDAYRLFYSGRYEEAAAIALAERTTAPGNLAAWELRSSALLFQIKRTFGEPRDKDKAWKACAECQPLLDAFLTELTEGRTHARAAVAQNAGDMNALFYLGKLNLNYV